MSRSVVTNRAALLTDRDCRGTSPLTTRVCVQGSAVRVSVRGDLDLVGARALNEALTPVLAQGPAHVIVDLRGVEFIDSTGVRELLHQHAMVTRRNGLLELSVEDTQAVYRTLALSGVTDIIARCP